MVRLESVPRISAFTQSITDNGVEFHDRRLLWTDVVSLYSENFQTLLH